MKTVIFLRHQVCRFHSSVLLNQQFCPVCFRLRVCTRWKLQRHRDVWRSPLRHQTSPKRTIWSYNRHNWKRISISLLLKRNIFLCRKLHITHFLLNISTQSVITQHSKRLIVFVGRQINWPQNLFKGKSRVGDALHTFLWHASPRRPGGGLSWEDSALRCIRPEWVRLI